MCSKVFNPLLHLPRSRGRRRNEHVCSVFSPKPGGDTEGVENLPSRNARTFSRPVKVKDTLVSREGFNLMILGPTLPA